MHADVYPREPDDRTSWPDMNYLLSEAAQARYVLAAHYVRDCPHVVEIGGFKTPITGYLGPGHESVLVLDPKITEYHDDRLGSVPCRVDHVPAPFQTYEFALTPGSYGLVILGMSIKRMEGKGELKLAELDRLVELIEGAAVAVIEFAVDWALGRREAEVVLARTSPRIALSLDIDIAGNPGAETRHHLRRFVVLRADGRTVGSHG